MSGFQPPLENIKIASPCNADWGSMFGNERKRFCGECNLHVYNLSGMSRAEAERLITETEGAICVRFFRRADGTVLTQDCPVGWARIKKRISVIASGALAIFMSAFSGGFLATAFESFEKPTEVMGTVPISAPLETREPYISVMGNISPNRPAASPKERRLKLKPVSE